MSILDPWLGVFSAVMALGCAVAYIRLSRRFSRYLREHSEDAVIGNWARTHALVVDLPSGKMNTQLDALRWSTDHTRQLRGGSPPSRVLPEGVRIEYRGEEIDQTPDKARNTPLR